MVIFMIPSGMIYKRIQWPSARFRTWLLIPALTVLILLLVLRPNPAFPLWAVVIGGISIVSYLGVMTYACIKQKCYMQLAMTYLTAMTAVAAFLAMRC